LQDSVTVAPCMYSTCTPHRCVTAIITVTRDTGVDANLVQFGNGLGMNCLTLYG